MTTFFHHLKLQKDPDPGSGSGYGSEIPDFQLEDPDPKLLISDPEHWNIPKRMLALNTTWHLIGELMLEPPDPEEEIDVEAAEEGQEEQEHHHGPLLPIAHSRSTSNHAAQDIKVGTGTEHLVANIRVANPNP